LRYAPDETKSPMQPIHRDKQGIDEYKLPVHYKLALIICILEVQTAEKKCKSKYFYVGLMNFESQLQPFYALAYL